MGKKQLPTEEEIAKIRDAYLAAYVRRNEVAVPHPDTSLYAVLEAAAIAIAPIYKLVPGSFEMLLELCSLDEDETICPPENEEAYDPKGRGAPKIKQLRGPETSEMQEWECARNNEGSF